MPNSTKIKTSSLGISFIPTKFLSDILEEHFVGLSNGKSLELVQAFSSHSFTRTAAGWGHELRMHSLLSGTGLALPIFRDNAKMNMPTSSHLLPGTASGIKRSAVSDSFYWIPSTINFPGIDSVLGDTSGNIYALQATIADDHTSPIEGIQRIWEKLTPDVREGRRWHFVVVADSLPVADHLVARFSAELDGFTLGHAHVTLQVWGCVLPHR